MVFLDAFSCTFSSQRTSILVSNACVCIGFYCLMHVRFFNVSFFFSFDAFCFYVFLLYFVHIFALFTVHPKNFLVNLFYILFVYGFSIFLFCFISFHTVKSMLNATHFYQLLLYHIENEKCIWLISLFSIFVFIGSCIYIIFGYLPHSANKYYLTV